MQYVRKIRQYLEITFLLMAHNEWDLLLQSSAGYRIQLLSSTSKSSSSSKVLPLTWCFQMGSIIATVSYSWVLTWD